jgi:threonine dehydrogenase-like Zn-dependent dehydrogenase
VPQAVRDMTAGRGTDSVIDAVGMEAHGSTVAGFAHTAVGLMPDALGRRMMEKAGLDKLSVLHAAISTVRRGGTISLSGVYGGMIDPLPMMELFDKQIQLRMGQANVRRWIEEILPLVEGDGDPLGVEDLATHRVPLEEAPQAYADFQKKRNGTIKVLLQP